MQDSAEGFTGLTGTNRRGDVGRRLDSWGLPKFCWTVAALRQRAALLVVRFGYAERSEHEIGLRKNALGSQTGEPLRMHRFRQALHYVDDPRPVPAGDAPVE